MKLFRNRFLIGLLCIGLGLAVSLLAIPKLTQERAPDMVPALRLKVDVPAGEQIDADMLEAIAVDKNCIPDSVITSPESVTGQFAAADLFAGDYLTSVKVRTQQDDLDYLKTATDKGLSLVSITLPSLAAGVSGKVLPGDVISIMALMKAQNADASQTLDPEPISESADQGNASSDSSDNAVKSSGQYKTDMQIFPELRYLEVFSLSASDGAEASVNSRPEDEEKNMLPVTLTVFATEQQALLLADLESNVIIHISRVAGSDQAADFIDSERIVMSQEVASQ
jgi:pilus assembly protein CpaB